MDIFWGKKPKMIMGQLEFEKYLIDNITTGTDVIFDLGKYRLVKTMFESKTAYVVYEFMDFNYGVAEKFYVLD